MRDILAYSANFRSWSGGVAYAADLAARLDGSLTGVYVYPSPLYMLPPYGSADLLEAILENARDIERTAHASKDAFLAWSRTIGVRQANWQVAEGQLPQTLAHIGNWHDLLVLERNPELPWGAPAELGEIVLGSRLPCIVAPAGMREARLDRIALAWNGAAEAVRAIHAALPLLLHAKQVFLLEGTPRELDVEIGWKPPFDIDEYLARHSIAAEHIEIDADDAHAGEVLLDAALGTAANLLVMGAYGRTRFSEWVFGGATRSLLRDAPFPVFLRN
jgi:nucleotide-binding universal stress UspA family protein